MSAIIKTLIIDDHPAIIEGYKSILSVEPWGNILKITSANSCESAYNLFSSRVEFDLVILDIILPPFESQNIFSGEDLASHIRSWSPHCKIIIITSISNSFTLFNLIKKINPEGILVKSDVTPDEFIVAFEKIMNGENYQSVTACISVKDLMRDNIYIDGINRRIISLLSKGIKTKNLPNHMNLSLSAIDKRKAVIKDFFNIQKGNDEDIIREAKKYGYI